MERRGEQRSWHCPGRSVSALPWAHGPGDAGEASTNVQTGVHVAWRDRPRVCSEPRLGQLVLSCGSSSFFSAVAHALGVQNSSYHSCSDGRGGSFQLPTMKTDQQRVCVSTCVGVHVHLCTCVLLCPYVCVHMCLCAYAFVSICLCTHVFVYTYVCVHICLCTCVLVCMYICVHVCWCAHVSVHMCLCVRMCVCVHICLCARVFVCACVCVHMCLCVHVCARVFVCVYVGVQVPGGRL